MAESSLFTRAVVASMRMLYPENLAETSWDNTGLLLEAPYQKHLPPKANSVLLTIDLTKAVVDEAIQGNHSVVVAYHPIIFRGLKALTLENSQQTSLLRLAANGISVYSPHSAVDVVPGGMGDWLCDIVTGGTNTSRGEPATESKLEVKEAALSTLNTVPKHQSEASQWTYSKPAYTQPPSQAKTQLKTLPHKREVVSPSANPAISAANSAHKPSALNDTEQPYKKENTGAGRIIKFHEPQPLAFLITRIATALGGSKAIQIALPQQKPFDDIFIKTVGVMPGSGANALRSATPAPDLIFTGEMSHHEALAVIERGGVVIVLNHSNSERGYLSAVMQSKLLEEIKQQWQIIVTEEASNNKNANKNSTTINGDETKSLSSAISSEMSNSDSDSEVLKDNNDDDDDGDDGDNDHITAKKALKKLEDNGLSVVVSKMDQDPFEVMLL